MRPLLFILLIAGSFHYSNGQTKSETNKFANKTDTVWIDEDGEKVSVNNALRYKIIKKDFTAPQGLVVRTYFMDGKLFSEYHCYEEPRKDNPLKNNIIKQGVYREWFNNGNLKSQINFEKGKYHGELLTYWKNGIKHRIDNFSDGKLINGTCYDSTGVAVAYYPYEQMPVYPGGDTELLNFVNRNLRYPIVAQQNGVQGKIIVRFLVDKTGKVGRISVSRSLSPETDREACRVVSLLKGWMPGKQDGELVNVWYTLPVILRLE